MSLLPLKYQPGIYRNGTRYQAQNRWWNADLMRFFDGAWRPVGGWQRVTIGTTIGDTLASDLCTGTNGTAITSHTPDSGFTGYEAGIGAFALGASIQNNKIERTSTGAGTQTQHNYTATALPYDEFEYFADMTRPADASNQQQGLGFRGIGAQFSGGTNDGVYIYWDRVSSTLVDIKLLVQSNGVNGQTATLATNVAWAASAELCLGCTVDGASVQVWTAAAGTGAVAATRTLRGPATTLTPETFNDASHRRFCLWLRINAIGYRYDNIYLKEPDILGAPLTFDGICRKLFAWRQGTVGVPHLAIGTNTKAYTYAEEVLTDVTPVDFTPGDVDGGGTLVGPYGAGPYGSGVYGTGNPTVEVAVDPGSWQFDAFLGYLIGVSVPDGRLLRTLDGVTPMTAVSGAPTGNRGVVVTPESFVVLLGAGGDQRLIHWSGLEDIEEWTADGTTTSGDFPLPGSGRCMVGKRGRNETLIWTDEDLFSMQYVGGTLVYGVNKVGGACGIVSPHAVAVTDNKAIWMGQRSFYIYEGFTRTLELEVSDYVFSDFNRDQRMKCWAMSLAARGEVWFFYPSLLSQECDRYVIYNYVQNHSSVGELERTAGIDRGVFDFPFMASPESLYEHEKGTDMFLDDDDEDGGHRTPFLESGPIQLGNSDQVMSVLGFIPDEATLAGQVLGNAEATLFTSYRPGDGEDEVESGPYVLTSKTDIRKSGRLARLRVEEARRGTWVLGEVALDLQPAGLR